jgi:hypothetical protein
MPMERSFSFPPIRYLNCHNREPVGITFGNSPAKTKTSQGFSRGFSARVAASHSGIWGHRHFRVRPITRTGTPRSGVSQRMPNDRIGRTKNTDGTLTQGLSDVPGLSWMECGGEGGTRTPDPAIMSRVL